MPRSITDNPADDESGLNQAVFPLGFYVDFLEFLAREKHRVEVITYADLAWDDTCDGDWNYEDNYLTEWQRWKRSLQSGERDPTKIYIVLQHDVDDLPERTERVLKEEERLNLRSTVMIFNRRVDRRLLQKTGKVQEKQYVIDEEFLRSLEQRGWLIGYHSNAYERSGFDLERAAQIFVEDVRELRQRYRIDFFCPHGGVRDAEGRSNARLDLPLSERRSLRWVLNRNTVRFDGVFSDGAINSPNRDATERDMRSFVRRWKPGGRYRILTHPQYYHREFRQTKAFEGVRWYETMISEYSMNPPRSAWSGVMLGEKSAGVSSAIEAPVVLRAPDRTLGSRPIFIGGDGRSGTTLLNVILDSHPLLSVGPELHFAGPVGLGSYVLNCIDLIERKDPRVIGKALNDNPDVKPGVQFVRRVQRAGFEIDDLLRLIPEAQQQTSSDLESFADRCHLIDLLGQSACTRSGKSFWGFKIMREIRNVRKYADVWPQARFIHIIRDGRDVAASQMFEHGSWGYEDIERAANGWLSVIDEARRSAQGLSYFELRYEDLVEDPRRAMTFLLEFLEIPWDDAVLRHETMSHAMFDSHVRHPSREAVRQPINTTAIGRYARDLSVEQIAHFRAIAGERLAALGYPVS